MPSTYTVNLGIEKPATGEQSGTWGDTTNTNFDILDQAINGAVRVTLTSAGTSGSPNQLQITNGAASDGRNKWIEVYSASDLGGSAYLQLDPNDAEKILFIRNSLAGSQSILLFQGTYNSGRDLEVPAGVDMVVKFDGGGASAATVTDVYTKLRVTELTTPTLTATTADINGGTLDNSVIGGTTAAAITGTTIVANTSLNIAGDGATVTGIKDEDDMSSNSPTKLATQQSIKAYVDSQVGTVDTWAEVLANGATSGSTNPEVTAGQALKTDTINETTAGSGVTIDSVLLKDDVVNATDVETGSISANDGTASATIANSTGVMTIASSVLTTTDINGGSIDGTNIGASSAGTGNFTSLTSTGLTVNGDPALNGNVTITNTGTGAAAGPYLTLDRNSSSPADSDLIGILSFRGRDDGANATDYGTIAGKIADVTGATEDGVMLFNVISGGSSRDVLTLSHNESVFNNGSADQDFRVESDSNSHMLFVDAGNNRVGINQSSPSYDLDVNGTLQITGIIRRAGSVIFSSTGSLTEIGPGGDGSVSFHKSANMTTGDEMAIFGASEAVFNERSFDQDFRVESDSKTHMLFVDAGNNRLQVGGNVDLGGDTANFISSAGVFNQVSVGSSSTNNSLTLGNHTASDSVSNLITSSSKFGGLIQGGTNGNLVLGIRDNDLTDGLFVITGAGDQMSNDYSRLRVSVNPSNIIFNETGDDSNFRVETDNNGNALFVDGGQDSVSIRTGSRYNNGALSVNGTIAFVNQTAGTYIDNIGWIDFTDSGNLMRLHSGGSAGQSSAIEISTNISGAQSDAITVETGGAVVINQDGADRDFRIESTSTANQFFFDAGTGLIGINDGTPSNHLDINGSLSFSKVASRNISTGAVSNNYFVIYDLDFSSSGFSTNQHIIRIIAAGSTSGQMASADLLVTFKQQSGSKFWNIVPIQNDNLTLGYIWDASGGGTSNGNLKIYCQGPAAYSYVQVYATNRDGNPADNIIAGTFPMTDTGSAAAPAGLTSIESPLNYSGNKYNQSGRVDSTFVINEQSHDINFRVESNNNANMLFVDAGNDRIGIGNGAPNETLSVRNDSAADILSINGASSGASTNTANILFRNLFSAATGSIAKIAMDTGSSTDRGDLVISTSPASNTPTERIRVTQEGYSIIPGGVTLGTSAGTYAAANTLDDYEEGSWTPQLEDTSGNTTSWAGSAVGKYTKVGNMVTAWWFFSSSSTAITSRAYVKVTGLPFTNQISEYSSVCTISRVFDFTWNDEDYYIGLSGQDINLRQLGAGNTEASITPTGTQQRFSGGVVFKAE